MTNDNPRYRFEPDARTHRARWLVTLLTLAVLAVLAQPLRAQTDNVVRVGVYNFEPLVFVDKEGAPKGLYLDALEYVAAREGWQIEYVPGTWAENLSRLEASEIDLLPSIGYTEARAEKLDFTREHLFLDWAIVYRGKGQPIETVLDLEGKTIAALKGSIYTEGLTRLLNQFDLHSPIVEMNQYTEVLAAVDRGEVDAGIITKVYGLVLEGRYSQIEATDIFFSPVKILFAVPKGQHPQILDALDRNFAALKADENSPYHTWLDKWIGIYQAKPVLPVTFLWGFAGALVLLGFLLGFAILLRRQVAQRTRELEADITARTRTEELLRESERKFRDVFESANVGKSITLPTGQVSVNRAFADWLGYSQEELTDKTWQELTPPEDITAIEAIIAPILKGDRESARFVKRYVHRDGSFLWADVSTTLRRDEAGRPLHFITTAVDITERIQAEEERSQAQKLFQMIFNLSPVATTLSSISDRVIADANNATIAWLGYTRDELVGIPSSNVDYWVNAEERQKAFSILTEQGRIADFEFVYRTKTGRTGHAVSYAEIVELGGNRYVLSSMIDITERKRAEDELRASEERFASAFRASPAGMTITRIADGKFIDANDAFCQMFEFSREEVIGHTSTELNMWSPEERKKLIEEQIRTGGLQNVELSARAKSGRLVDILFSSRPIELAGEMHHVTTMIDISERKQAQEQLAERHATLTAMLESAATPVFSLDSQYRYTSFNSVHAAVMKALYGAEIEIGESMLEYQTVLEDRQIAQENLDRALGGEQFIESGYSGEAGRARRYFEIAHNPIRDPDGNVIGVSVFASDITERERAEEALRESEAFTKAVMDNLPVGVAVNSIDPSVIFDYMNDNFPAFYRTTREALEIPDNFWDAVYEDPAFREEMKTRILADVASEEPGRMYWEDIPITRKGEQTTFVSARNVKVPGKPLMISTVWDITERIHAEHERQKFFLLAESSSEFIGMCDLEMQPIYVNPAGVRMVGLPDMAAACRIKVQDYFFPEDQAFIENEFFPRVLREGHGDVEIRLRHFESGEPLWFYYFLFSVHDAAGEVIGWATVSHDITERKRAQEEQERLQAQLTQAQKMESVGRLAGGVAHDFNNMLTIILGRTELMLMRAAPDDSQRASLEEIQKAAQRSADLTRQLLAFSRKQTIAPKVLALNVTIEGILKLLQRLIGENIDLAWMPVSNLWPVKVDPAQIDQILANLCVNARDAIAGVGKITIETGNVVFDEAYCARHVGYVPGDFVLLAVSDNGCGMNAETLSHLFEPFFTTKAMGKGTGLGLAIVYGIVKQNNGFVNVYSEPGHGTSFKIYLPRHREGAHSETEKPEPSAEASGHETILLVEDEPAILEMTTAMLEELGYSVLAARTPGEAVRLAGVRNGRIDLLMTDVVMPEMNGRDLAGKLQSLYPDIRLLFMSGYTADVIAHQGVLDPGVHFIQKPFAMNVMAAKIRAALENG